MAFVSSTQSRELDQTLKQMPTFDSYEAFTFGESLAAGVGQVFDEELSISQGLNREGWQQRQSIVKEKLARGEIGNVERYRNRRGRFNYELLAQDLQDPGIKTNEQLNQERKEILAGRRKYREQVQRGGDALGFFLGQTLGFALEPLNVMTMPVGYSVAAAKSLTVLGIAARSGLYGAALNATTEAAIQPLVYAHKQDIESPYAVQDSIEAIGMAAAAGFVFDGISGGILGYMKKIRTDFDEAFQDGFDRGLQIREEEVTAIRNIDRTIRNLEELRAKKFDINQIKADLIEETKAELIARSGERLTRGQEKALRAERRQLFDRLSRTTTTTADVELEIKDIKTKRMPARKAKELAREAAQETTDQEIASIRERINLLDDRLGRHNLAKQAESDLSRLEQGILPKRQQDILEQIQKESMLERRQYTHMELVEQDKAILRKMEEVREQAYQPTRTIDRYQEPDTPLPPSDLSGRADELMNEVDISTAKGMEKFETLDTAVAFDEAGNLTDAKALVKNFDDQIEGLNEIHRCYIGGPG